MLVGIHTSDYKAAKLKAPDLKVGRVFHGANKTADNSAKLVGQLKADCDPLIAAGLGVYPSFKFPPNDVIMGLCDTQIKAGLFYLQGVAKAGTPVWCTTWHEPENDMTAATFVAMFDHVYALKEQFAPDIKFGVVNMGYQWRSTAARPVADQKAWMSFKKADFIHNDVYSGNGEPLSGMPKWTIWLNAVQKYTLVKTIGLAERGYNNKGDQVNVMKADQAYLDSLKSLGLNVDMYLYWDSMDTNGVDNYKLSAVGWAQLAKFAKDENVTSPPPPPPPPPVVFYPTHSPVGSLSPAICDRCYAALEDKVFAEAHYKALHP